MDFQFSRNNAMSRISVRTYGRTIAGTTNRLSLRTDERTDAWTTAVKSLCAMNRLSVHTYGQTNTLTAIDQSYVRQPRFGSQDAAIWGGELKDNLNK